MRQVSLRPIFSTKLGVLYKGDCLEILPHIQSETVTTVFADPPYNLGKYYGTEVNDNLPELEYLNWCKCWTAEGIRTLISGGAFILYNLPKWNIILADYLLKLGMSFRHWIAVSMKLGLPIPGRLYPSHYSLLYFTKGKPKTFKKIRVPIEKCRHCGKETKDYGGHRDVMNANGVNLTGVWNDIPPIYRFLSDVLSNGNAFASMRSISSVTVTTSMRFVLNKRIKLRCRKKTIGR